MAKIAVLIDNMFEDSNMENPPQLLKKKNINLCI